LAGRTQPQVGRWHSFRKKDEDEIDTSVGGTGLNLNKNEAEEFGWPQGKDGKVNWEEVWKRSASQNTPSLLPLLPEGLREIE
jgi:hypothetical protein